VHISEVSEIVFVAAFVSWTSARRRLLVRACRAFHPLFVPQLIGSTEVFRFRRVG
jgi:hypothetical protein